MSDVEEIDVLAEALKASQLGTTLRFPAGLAGTRTVVQVSVPEDLAQTWNLSCNPPPRTTSPNPIGGPNPVQDVAENINAQVIIRWGNGGNQNLAIVDFRQGWSVNLWGSFVQADIEVFEPLSQALTLGMNISPGEAGQSTSRPTKTQPCDPQVLAGLGNGILPVPRYATKGCLHYVGDDGNKEIVVRQMQGITILSEWDVGPGFGERLLTIPVQRTCNMWQISNTAGLAISRVAVEFELDLG